MPTMPLTLKALSVQTLPSALIFKLTDRNRDVIFQIAGDVARVSWHFAGATVAQAIENVSAARAREIWADFAARGFKRV